MNGTGSPQREKRSFVGSCVDGIVDLKKNSTFLRRTIDRLPLWVTPNMVTVFRGALVVPIIWSVLVRGYTAALLIFIAAMLLDFVDGALAEIRNIKTPLGTFLDPLSDKILICGTLAALIPRLSPLFIPFIYGICMIAVALTVVRVAKMNRQKSAEPRSIAAKPAGKLKCITESIAVGLILLGLALGSQPVIWTGGALLVGALILAGMSLWSQAKG